MIEFKPGDRVVDATDEDDNPCQMHGTIVRAYEPAEDEDPGWVVQWDTMPEPTEELGVDLAREAPTTEEST